MSNGEKYKNEMLDYNGENFCEDFIEPRILESYGKECSGLACGRCRIIQQMWLNEEYKEPEVDWSTVEVDTKILVRNDETPNWKKRYFAKFENGIVYAFEGGATSFSTNQIFGLTAWEYAELYEEGEE